MPNRWILHALCLIGARSSSRCNHQLVIHKSLPVSQIDRIGMRVNFFDFGLDVFNTRREKVVPLLNQFIGFVYTKWKEQQTRLIDMLVVFIDDRN